jgi:hypothetical protein
LRETCPVSSDASEVVKPSELRVLDGGEGERVGVAKIDAAIEANELVALIAAVVGIFVFAIVKDATEGRLECTVMPVSGIGTGT